MKITQKGNDVGKEIRRSVNQFRYYMDNTIVASLIYKLTCSSKIRNIKLSKSVAAFIPFENGKTPIDSNRYKGFRGILTLKGKVEA